MRGGRQIADDHPSAVVSAMSWLRERRALSLSLALAGLAVALVVDLFVPADAIAAAYLIVIIFAAIALPRRTAVAIGSAGLVLTLVVMAAQGRMSAQNLLMVGFGVLAGAGMFVLVSLHDSVESLYTEQRKILEHESFTVRLVDALLPLPDPVEVKNTTVRLLGEQLGASRTACYEVDEAGRLVERSAHARRDTPVALDLEAFAAELAAADGGRALVLRAPKAGPEPAQRQRAALEGAGLQSCLAAPIHEDGELVAAVVVCDAATREWTQTEADLLAASVTRAWAEVRRARSDAALRETEEASRLSEARFRLIVTTANEGIAMSDPGGVITYANDRLTGLLGFAHDDLIGKSVLDLLAADEPGDDGPGAGWPRDGARNDFRFTRRDGSPIWLLVTNAPLRDDEGRYLGNLAMLTDITERKATEAAVARQARLLDSVQDAILAVDGGFKVTYWNDQAEELFGWTRDEAMGRSSEDLLQGDFAGSSREAQLASLLQQGSYRGEVLYRHKDGHEIWADVNSRVVRAESGVVDAVVTSCRDIRDRKYAQRALTWEAARLRAIVEAAPVGLGIVAADGEVLLRNDVLRDIWMGEAPVTSVAEFEAYKGYWPGTDVMLRPEDWPAAEALKSGRSFAGVVVDIERFDGTRGTIVLSTAPIKDDGVVQGAVTIVQDVTSMREAEQALRILTDEVRTLHESVVLDPTTSSIELAGLVVTQAALLLGSDGSSIFLLGEDKSLRRVAGVGAPDGEGIDDLIAQAIGDQTTAVRALPTPVRQAPDSPGRIMLAVPLVIRDEVYGALAFTYLRRRSLEDTQIRIARAFADQAALAIENARLRARVEETAVEAERTRLARDLHDGVTQSLFAASLKAEALADMLDDRETALSAVEELRRLTRGSLAGMRTMLLEMRADALQRTPLPELLRHLVEASAGRIGADVKLNVEGRRRQLPPDAQSALYRIAQEALNNVARHAKAGQAWVDLRLSEEAVRLQIGDDGRGFEPGGELPGHFGLQNMRERAEAIGGRFGIVSGPGHGTVVSVEWPLQEGEDRE